MLSAAQGILRVSDDDALKLATLRQTATGRKRRVDEDYVSALQASVSEGRAGNSGILARAYGDVTAGVANSWDAKFLRGYVAQGHLTFANAEVCALTYDAARLGQPPEETVLFCLERVDTRETMWLPPQAPSCSQSIMHIN